MAYGGIAAEVIGRETVQYVAIIDTDPGGFDRQPVVWGEEFSFQ